MESFYQVHRFMFQVNNYLETSGLLNLLLLLTCLAVLLLCFRSLHFIKQQGKNEQETNLAYKLLQTVVRLRDRYRILRNRIIHVSEYPNKYRNQDSAQLSPREEAEIYRYVFFKRWQDFSSEWEKLYDRILLSELYWKPWCRTEVSKMQKMINRLKFDIEQLIVLKCNELMRNPKADPIQLEQLNHKVFLSDKKDAELQRFEHHTQNMLNFLKKI